MKSVRFRPAPLTACHPYIIATGNAEAGKERDVKRQAVAYEAIEKYAALVNANAELKKELDCRFRKIQSLECKLADFRDKEERREQRRRRKAKGLPPSNTLTKFCSHFGITLMINRAMRADFLIRDVQSLIDEGGRK